MALACCAAARAIDPADPLGTRELVPPLPSQAAGASCPWRPSAPLALTEVVDQVLCNNPQTREIWAAARAQAAAVGIARADYLPGIAAGAGYSARWDDSGRTGSSPDQGSASLGLSYLLYDFGARAARAESARELLAVALANSDTTVQSLYLAAIRGFYGLLATRALLDARVENERAADASLKSAQARRVAGTATLADELQARTAWSQAVFDRVRGEGAAASAQGSLASLMGYDPDWPFDLALPPEVPAPAAFEQDLPALIELARRNRPDLRAAESQVRAAQADLQAARAAGRPTISATTDLGVIDSAPGERLASSAIGVNLSMPLFTGFSTTYRVQAAAQDAAARAATRDRVALQVALDVWQAYHDLRTQTQALASSAELLASATQNERVARGRYGAGVGTIVDLLNAQGALAAARQQQVQTRLDWNVARAALVAALGQLDMASVRSLAGASPAPEHP
ncbi:MAG: TolC family protein [Gammaproteobacteria bacterium]